MSTQIHEILFLNMPLSILNWFKNVENDVFKIVQRHIGLEFKICQG